MFPRWSLPDPQLTDEAEGKIVSGTLAACTIDVGVKQKELGMA